MTRTRLQEILDSFKAVSMSVYGDYCLDVYWHLDKAGSEVSIETGIPTQAVGESIYAPGGAANVVKNLIVLGAKEVNCIGIIGADIFGIKLLSLLNNLGANTHRIITQKFDFQTFTYIKRIDQGKEKARIDFGNGNKRSKESDDQVLTHLSDALSIIPNLIYNQQVTNSINRPEFLQESDNLFSLHPGSNIFIDSRHYRSKITQGIHKANVEEFSSLSHQASLTDFLDFAREKSRKSAKPFLLTMGNKGVIVGHQSISRHIKGLPLVEPLDTVGAGDTFLACLSLAMGGGANPFEAAEVANLAAAVSTRKLFQTGDANQAEILTIWEEFFGN